MSNLLLFDVPSAGVATVTPAPDFHRDGRVFRTDDGKIFQWASGSEFPAVHMFLNGEIAALEQICAQRYAAGQRMFTSFTTSEDPLHRLGEGGNFSDQQIWDATAAFADWLRVRGFNFEACAFQGTSNGTMPGIARQIRHWNATLDIAKARHFMSVSFSQEWFKQSVDWRQLRQPTDQTWDGGGIPDGGSSGIELLPSLWVCPMRGSHDSYQTGRGPEWMRYTKGAMEISGATRIGCLTRETMGADEMDRPGRSNVPVYFFWSAAVAREMSLGEFFHSQAGATGKLWGPNQLACAVAHHEALAMIPPECQLGGYAKAVGAAVVSYDDEPGGSLRTYGMQVSAHEQWCVVILRKELDGTFSPSYPRNGDLIDPATSGGWRIAQRLGPMGTVLQAVR